MNVGIINNLKVNENSDKNEKFKKTLFYIT